MGRLFWKFFLSILLAQVAATIGIGGAVWLRDQAHQRNGEPTLDLGPPAIIMLDAAAATLRHGGVDGLRELAATSRRMRLYVLDDQGNELLGRAVPPRLRGEVERNLETGAPSHAVARLTAPDGRHYLAFASRIPGVRPDMASLPQESGPAAADRAAGSACRRSSAGMSDAGCRSSPRPWPASCSRPSSPGIFRARSVPCAAPSKPRPPATWRPSLAKRRRRSAATSWPNWATTSTA
jgi:hypothetical protein